jgi:hypothetical protein
LNQEQQLLQEWVVCGLLLHEAQDLLLLLLLLLL